MKAYMKAYYQEHRERTAERSKKWRVEHPSYQKGYMDTFNERHPGRLNELKKQEQYRLKDFVFRYYSQSEPCCAQCGINDIDMLTIDHINDDGAEMRRASGKGVHFCGNNFYRWLKKMGFPKGFQVLCANCNLKKEITRRRDGNNLHQSF